MAEKDQFYSFDEALKELRLKEEELKRLVSEGEIRAFREGDTMKLRRADVENLRNELSGGEVVDLGDVKEELVFEDDNVLEDDAGMATQEIGMATEAISNVETVIEDDVEEASEVELEEARAEEPAAGAAPRATLTARPVEVPEEFEGLGLRAALLLTTIVLVLAVPVVLSFGSGRASSLAQSMADLFGGK